MDKQLDDLSRSLAEGVSRRAALRKLGFGLAGTLLATLGFRSRAEAAPGRSCWICLNGPICSTVKPGKDCKKTKCSECGIQCCA